MFRKAGTIAAMLGLVMAVLAARNGPGEPEAAPTSVVLQPAQAPGPGAFVPALVEPGPSSGPVGPLPAGSVEDGRISGSSNELYAGERDKPSCDARKLVRGLLADTAVSQAWSGAAGIALTDIADYVATLTSAALRVDALVTDYTLKDKTARPLKSVLQAGTAVLIDRQGVPRVRCASGNPLRKPVDIEAAQRFQGDRWPGFKPDGVASIVPYRKQLGLITLRDTKTGANFARVPGSILVLDLNLPPAGTNVTVVEPGQQTKVAGGKWPPGAPIEVTFSNPSTTLGKGAADSEGNFSLAVKVPPQAPPGAHSLTILGGGVNVSQAAYVVPRTVKTTNG